MRERGVGRRKKKKRSKRTNGHRSQIYRSHERLVQIPRRPFCHLDKTTRLLQYIIVSTLQYTRPFETERDAREYLGSNILFSSNYVSLRSIHVDAGGMKNYSFFYPV